MDRVSAPKRRDDLEVSRARLLELFGLLASMRPEDRAFLAGFEALEVEVVEALERCLKAIEQAPR